MAENQLIDSTRRGQGERATILNPIMASKEAQDSGYDEAILLTNSGRTVAEGPGENIFVVQDCELVTPPRSSDILLGMTRDTR